MSDRNRIPHVDGLRAFAVISVIAFHAGVPGFGGGFVGVDVFFVISGFLIINHIVAEMNSGEFSFWRFYARRTLRLLPPLAVMLIAITALAAAILVSPVEWEWFALSAMTSGLFVSNFYFLVRQGYFDLTAYEKPLIHTWSLSVEEQFYLIVPLLVLVCFVAARRLQVRPGPLLAGLAVTTFVVSLIGSILLTSEVGRNQAFYLMHWRAWEFAAGGAAGALTVTGRFRNAVAEAAGLAGLALLLVSLSLNSGNTFFPGYLAVLPVAGTVLVIAGGVARPSMIVARLLSTTPLPGIGLISYGWYLWHWPLISLARIADFDEKSLARDLAMVLIALALAMLTYAYIERPIRRWRRNRTVAEARRIVAGGAAAAVGVALATASVGGVGYVLATMTAPIARDAAGLIEEAACPESICTIRPGAHAILVGDSHADRMIDVLEKELQPLKISLERVRQGDATGDIAIFIYRWVPHFAARPATAAGGGFIGELERRVDKLAAAGTEVLLIGPVVEFGRRGTECVLRAHRYGMGWDFCGVPRSEVEARRKDVVAALRRIAAEEDKISYADPIDLFCDASFCRPFDDGVVVMKDVDHLTNPYGAAWLMRGLKEYFWWVLGDGRHTPPPAQGPLGNEIALPVRAD